MKPFTCVAILVFGLVAAFQVARFFLEWPVMVNGVTIPLWVSLVIAVLAAALAVMLWREARAPLR